MKPLKLYDQNMTFVAFLENATDKGYTKKLNDLWQATFSMPANDPKAKLCTPFRIVELYDGEERVDLFRILPSIHSSDESSEKIVFNCEHVLATLTDDLLFQYHERNNIPTSNVLSYILGFQTTSKWQLGQVDFSYLFSYKWESENLLGSLFSVPEPFIDEYQWTWDTTTFPWTLNLISPSQEIKTWIRYGRNLKNVEKRTDPTNLCTRLYGLGYGEGVNQLTISDVNGGLPYIQASTAGTYGIISRVFADMKEENANTLKGKMQAILEQLKIPRMEYAVGTAHLYQITDKKIDDFYLGAYCKTIDKEDDLTFTARVVTINKPDIDGAPGDVDIEIANSPQDVAKSISGLANRQRINEVYAQGATNLLAQDFQDNADSSNPAIMKFYIPQETVRINKMELNFKTTKFRAYSKAIEGGGAVATTTAAGGSTVESSDPGVWTLYPPQYLLPDFMEFAGSHTVNISISGTTGSGGDPAHTHSFSDSDSDSIGGHAHEMYSVAHTHDVDIPNHFHAISLPDHTHGIEYGIYLNPVTATSITVTVDGNVIPGLDLNENGVDLIPYLAVDSDGKITRGTWHEIQISPNNLARVEANIVTQLFIQSRGGGNY